MVSNYTAHIISIGTEILLGEITDTNSVFIAKAMRDIGVNVYYMTSVGDNIHRIENTIRNALVESDIIITCGGLGPTVDDMTREGVARATDRTLYLDSGLIEEIQARFQQFNVKMTDNNRRQAYLPEKAIAISNEVGTAPAFIVEVGEKCVISLPGVPREMKYLLQEKVIPYLKERYQIQDQIILARVLKTAGIGESTLDTLIGEELLNHQNPSIGLAAHSGQIDIRITAKANTRHEATQLIAPIEAQVRERVGTYIFGADSDQLEKTLIDLLEEQHATLSILEVGTQGIIHNRLAPFLSENSPILSHESFADTRQLLSDSDKQQNGEDLAQSLTQECLEKHHSTAHITVISNPDIQEGADNKAETIVMVATQKQTRIRKYGFGGKSENLQQFAGNWSLSVAWYLLKELFDDTQS